ncbi:Rhodanese- sulfurtransferase [Quaeritorhiza haematococci]|nr:Rhodanese- sulfurtransferase [Quaeritorhiza haematococci]
MEGAVDMEQLLQQAAVPEERCKELARDATQLLVNQIFTLPVEKSTEGFFAQLPAPTTLLPRAKPLPKDKPMSRWEKFAKAKGIQKRKKSRMEYDDATGEWRPRFGSQSKQNDAMNDWLIPVPKNADPYEDQYEKKRDAKKQRVEKNQKQQARNASERELATGSKNQRDVRKQQLQQQIKLTKGATASMGKFDKQLEGDVKLKAGMKRKFESTTISAKDEAKKALEIVQKMNKAGSKKKGM